MICFQHMFFFFESVTIFDCIPSELQRFVFKKYTSLTLFVDTSRFIPLFFCIHLAVLLVMIAALLNMCDTWMSKSLGTAIPRDLATSDNVWIQFSTLVLCSKVNHWHCATRKAALNNWTKIGWRLWKKKIRNVKHYNLMIYTKKYKLGTIYESRKPDFNINNLCSTKA